VEFPRAPFWVPFYGTWATTRCCGLISLRVVKFYADDTAMVVIKDSLLDTIRRADLCVAIVVREIRQLGLEVSPHKTEIVAFGGPRRASGRVWVDGIVVPIA